MLAEPNLTAQSGETASFLAGGEFPIPVAGNAPATASSHHRRVQAVRRQPGGGADRAVADQAQPRIRPEVSQLSTNGAVSLPVAGGMLTIPALTVRRAETTVELGSGQSFAIAGLLQRTSTDDDECAARDRRTAGDRRAVQVERLPARRERTGDHRHAVHRAARADRRRRCALPTDGFRPATDLDRILLGRQMAPAPGGESSTPGSS